MLLAASLTLLAQATAGQATPVPLDLVVQSGQTYSYDTAAGPLRLRNLTIRDGGTFRAVGREPLLVLAQGVVRVDGTLDASGFDAQDVLTLNTGNFPEFGADGGPAAGSGGTASVETDRSTPAGTSGSSTSGASRGGGGGESAYTAASAAEDRRPGGGGGGVLALDQPETGDPDDPVNQGLVAEAGVDGAPGANGALSGMPPARGGAAGTAVFSDGDPSNDYWGRRIDAGGQLVVGELAFPLPGRGGGAGGDAVPSDVFPHPDWSPASDEKGAAGGGGGGLAAVIARTVVVGPAGVLRSDGGDGGRGENTVFLDSIGGNGGGGSGGYLVVAAQTIDLTQAGELALSAIGGLGAEDFDGQLAGNGGNGGPGVIQLHTPAAAGVLLPAGKELADISRPDAWSLLPF